jgi:hypothetical protein
VGAYRSGSIDGSLGVAFLSFSSFSAGVYHSIQHRRRINSLRREEWVGVNSDGNTLGGDCYLCYALIWLDTSSLLASVRGPRLWSQLHSQLHLPSEVAP